MGYFNSKKSCVERINSFPAGKGRSPDHSAWINGELRIIHVKEAFLEGKGAEPGQTHYRMTLTAALSSEISAPYQTGSGASSCLHRGHAAGIEQIPFQKPCERARRDT